MEIVIVMTVISILLAVAIPIYMTHVRRAKEVVLKTNLDEIFTVYRKVVIDRDAAS